MILAWRLQFNWNSTSKLPILQSPKLSLPNLSVVLTILHQLSKHKQFELDWSLGSNKLNEKYHHSKFLSQIALTYVHFICVQSCIEIVPIQRQPPEAIFLVYVIAALLSGSVRIKSKDNTLVIFFFAVNCIFHFKTYQTAHNLCIIECS